MGTQERGKPDQARETHTVTREHTVIAMLGHDEEEGWGKVSSPELVWN